MIGVYSLIRSSLSSSALITAFLSLRLSWISHRSLVNSQGKNKSNSSAWRTEQRTHQPMLHLDLPQRIQCLPGVRQPQQDPAPPPTSNHSTRTTSRTKNTTRNQTTTCSPLNDPSLPPHHLPRPPPSASRRRSRNTPYSTQRSPPHTRGTHPISPRSRPSSPRPVQTTSPTQPRKHPSTQRTKSSSASARSARAQRSRRSPGAGRVRIRGGRAVPFPTAARRAVMRRVRGPVRHRADVPGRRRRIRRMMRSERVCRILMMSRCLVCLFMRWEEGSLLICG